MLKHPNIASILDKTLESTQKDLYYQDRPSYASNYPDHKTGPELYQSTAPRRFDQSPIPQSSNGKSVSFYHGQQHLETDPPLQVTSEFRP